MARQAAKPADKLPKILKSLRAEMPRLEQTYHVKTLGIFGPYARGEQTADGVLNMTVEYRNLPTLISLAELEDHLGNLLGVKVDLGPKESLRPHVKGQVLEELVEV